MGILQGRTLQWVAIPSSKESSQPSDGAQASHIAGRFFTVWATMEVATMEAQEYGMGSLSLFQGIFLTQELNQGLLHCRQILYQLDYQRKPHIMTTVNNIVLYIWKLLRE